ncbi:unnamed protein product [Mytilus coruscus]|uniref:CARD domain-containing protein n=1 Tax=Mytilus coruscus TaxID=42192 RepID=A0A6J8EPT9_MYTCO|nr:unnamed protein product [Mytilus coruscus]
MAESGEDVVQSEDEADKYPSQTDLHSVSSPETVHNRLYHFYDQIIQDTILDTEVLDLLISRCILLKEDREEIEHHPRQSDRNKCILDLIIQRPHDSFSLLFEVLKDSRTCSKDLIERMEGQLFSNRKVLSQSKIKSCEVLDLDQRTEINFSGVQAKINRKLIDQIRSEQDYHFFLEALKEDSTNAKLASDLESTDVKPDELKSLQTGAVIPSLTNTPGFQTLVTLVSMAKAVQISNTEPESHDTSLSADLYRLQSWYKKMLKMKLMDSHQYQQFVQTVKEKKKNIQNLKEKLMKMEIEREEVIPKNIRDQMKKQINDWEKKDEMFVTTRASDNVMKYLQNNSCLTLTAPSGVGKSFCCTTHSTSFTKGRLQNNTSEKTRRYRRLLSTWKSLNMLIDKNINIDFIIEIPEDYLETYLERFIKDWSAGNVRVIFTNKNMEVPLFRQQLLQYLTQLDKPQQVGLVNKQDTVLPKEHHGSGSTPLVGACFHGYIDMVQWMLHNDVDVDQCRDDHVTGLLMASQQGYTDIVKLLLEKDPNVNLCNNNLCSPLHIASQNGHTDIVMMLLERNPNIDLCNTDDCSPLYLASQQGHTDIISPLYIASAQGHTDIVKLLLERNPNIDLCDNIYGCSPLYMASQNGHTDIVKLLLERNPNIDLCDNKGRSLLCKAKQKGHADIVTLLFEKKVEQLFSSLH